MEQKILDILLDMQGDIKSIKKTVDNITNKELPNINVLVLVYPGGKLIWSVTIPTDYQL